MSALGRPHFDPNSRAQDSSEVKDSGRLDEDVEQYLRMVRRIETAARCRYCRHSLTMSCLHVGWNLQSQVATCAFGFVSSWLQPP